MFNTDCEVKILRPCWTNAATAGCLTWRSTEIAKNCASTPVVALTKAVLSDSLRDTCCRYHAGLIAHGSDRQRRRSGVSLRILRLRRTAMTAISARDRI
jgi:hypothetical protein